jgi:hypothetical protein
MGAAMNPEIVRYVFDRIPALAELHGIARLNAEEVIENAMADAIEDHIADCEPVGGAS